MEYITEKNEKYVFISKQSDLDELCDCFAQGELFANKFKFSERDFFISLLQSLQINYEDFKKTYFHYDRNRKIHIAESEFKYVWISTYGLIAKSKSTSNRAVNACLNQYTVISLLFKKALKVSQDENVYDIDSYNFGLLSELSPAIFHNLIFYIEVFCKAYLSLANVDAPKTHKLSLLYQETANIMASKEHDNSLFQVLILDPLYKFVDHLNNIPGGFKEHFVKYDDNPLDDTVIIFDPAELTQMMSILELSIDFISDYYHIGTETHYLKTNLYQRMLNRADTEEKKERIKKLYPHLANNNQQG